MVKVADNLVATSDFTVQLTAAQVRQKAALLKRMTTDDLTPLKVTDLMIDGQDPTPLLVAFDGQDFISLADGYYFARPVYQRVVAKVTEYLRDHPTGIDLGGYRDLTATSRKYAMMVLERLDKDGVTKRLNRVHVLNA